MKNWIKKNWSLIVFAATVIVDMQFHILEALVDTPKAIGMARFVGIVALFVVNIHRLNWTTQTRSNREEI